jgi:hypothetical protein
MPRANERALTDARHTGNAYPQCTAGVRQDSVEQPRRQFAVGRQITLDHGNGASQNHPVAAQHAFQITL